MSVGYGKPYCEQLKESKLLRSQREIGERKLNCKLKMERLRKEERDSIREEIQVNKQLIKEQKIEQQRKKEI